MALFGDADADLPLLTQFYQLAVPDLTQPGEHEKLIGSELDIWLGFCLHPDKGFTSPKKARPWSDYPIRGFGAEFEREPKEKQLPEQLDVLHHLGDQHQVLRAAMEAFLDHQVPPPNILGELKERVLRLREQHKRTLEWGADGKITLTIEDPRQRAWALRDDLYFTFLEATGALPVESAKTTLQRCEECQSIYVAKRSQQRFCSHRCRNTNAQRARRHPEKAV